MLEASVASAWKDEKKYIRLGYVSKPLKKRLVDNRSFMVKEVDAAMHRIHDDPRWRTKEFRGEQLYAPLLTKVTVGVSIGPGTTGDSAPPIPA